MKNFLASCLLGAALLTFAGCGQTAVPSASRQEGAPVLARQSSAPAENKKETQKMQRTIEIQAGKKIFKAILEDNAASEAFYEKLPLDITMTELNGNEKYYIFPERLPSSDQEVKNIRIGDLMLFGSNCAVLFYKDFSTSYRYTRLGRISNPGDLAEAVGTGNVHVIINRLK